MAKKYIIFQETWLNGDRVIPTQAGIPGTNDLSKLK